MSLPWTPYLYICKPEVLRLFLQCIAAEVSSANLISGVAKGTTPDAEGRYSGKSTKGLG